MCAIIVARWLAHKGCGRGELLLSSALQINRVRQYRAERRYTTRARGELFFLAPRLHLHALAKDNLCTIRCLIIFTNRMMFHAGRSADRV